MFGKKKNKDEGKVGGPTVLATNGEIDALTMTLIAAAYDKDDGVRQHFKDALRDIGLRQQNMFLSSCMLFLGGPDGGKVPKEHRVLLLDIMTPIIKEKLAELPRELGYNLVLLGVAEMTAKEDVKADWQQAASSMLVELGIRFGKEVLDELLKRFETNVMPHYFVMKTLGDFAVANPMYIVPTLKNIFGRALPLLGHVKHNNQRWVFAATLGHFCEAIIHYLANPELAEDKSITHATFHGEVFSAMELMFLQWLENKDVRLATIEAIGTMAPLIARDQFETFLPRLVTTYLGFYKKDKSHLPITQGLCSILRTAVKDGSRVLDPVLKTLFESLHPLVCMAPDFDDQQSVKNHNELLRCYETMGTVFSEHLVAFLLQKFEVPNPESRIGTLAIAKHVINRLDDELATQRELLVSGTKVLLNEENLRVRRAFAQTIIAMAGHGYLNLEGGQYLVDFLIQQCAITQMAIAKAEKEKPPKGVKDHLTPTQMRTMCDSILNLVTTTIPVMQEVLWPYLLEFIVPEKYTQALAVTCKSLVYLANKYREEESEEYYIDFDRKVNLPKPQAIIARLLTILSSPLGRNEIGLRILETLLALAEILHPSIADMWTDLIPKLMRWLEDKGAKDAYSQPAWEELLLRFLSLTIDEVADEDWTMKFGSELASQYSNYQLEENAHYKRMVHKLLGTVLKKTSHKKFVRDKLDEMFTVHNTADEAERVGFAQGYGYAAATHLDAVLEKLQQIMKNDMVAKKTGFLGLGSDKSKEQIDNIRCSVVLSFGNAAFYADLKLIQSRMEVHIINHIMPQFVSARHPAVQESLISATDLIGKAAHPSHLGEDTKFILKHRDELLGHLVVFITTGSTIQVRTKAFDACQTLVHLQPPLTPALQTQTVSQVLPVVYDLVEGPNATAAQVNDAVRNFENMLASILFMNNNLDTLTKLFRDIEKYVWDEKPLRRERSCQSILLLLSKYVEYKRKLPKELQIRDKECFVELGHWLGVCIPRCTDPVLAVRQAAMGNVELLLYIDLTLTEDDFAVAPSEYIELVATLKEQIETEELNEQFALVHKMTSVLATTVSAAELPDLLQTLMDGLTDWTETAASGTCVVLNGLIRARGPELEPHIAALLKGMLTAMADITSDQTMNGTLHALRTLGSHHLLGVVDELLKTPIPHNKHVVKALQVLAKDPKLATTMINHLVDILNNQMPYDEVTQDRKVKKTAKETPNAATHALGDIFEAPELHEFATHEKHFPMLLGTLLLRVGVVNQVDSPEPRAAVIRSLRQFFVCTKEEELLEDLTKGNHFEGLTGMLYPDSLIAMAGGICKYLPEKVEELYGFLHKFLAKNYPEQRVVVAAVFAEFINKLDITDETKPLLQKLLNALLVRLVDTEIAVKILSIRGLGNLASAGAEEVNRFSTTVLSALMSGVTDPDQMIALESMSGLAKILELVDGANIAPVLITLCLRIKPSFRSENNLIRSAAFTLFGTLWRFGQGESEADFEEQVHNNLVAYLLHANDEDQRCKGACRHALKQLSPLMKSDELKGLLAGIEGGVNDYAEWLDDVSKQLIECYPERLNFYVMECVAMYPHKTWFVIKANSAILTGVILGNMPPELRRTVNLPHICGALKNLLKEPSADVRSRTCDAIALLYDL